MSPQPPPAGPATVLIADHPLTRLGIRVLLDPEPYLQTCAEATDAAEAIRVAGRMRPDVCLIGWQLPGSGLAAVAGIARVSPGSAVVIVGGLESEDDLIAALRSGAMGYLPTRSASRSLVRVIRRVLAGEMVVPRAMVGALVSELRGGGARGGKLTARESQVLRLLERGRSTGEMAQQLGISPVTIRRHVSDLVRKLGVESRASLINRRGRLPGRPRSGPDLRPGPEPRAGFRDHLS